MNARQFFDLTAEVMDLQTEYIKTRDALVYRRYQEKETELKNEIDRVRTILGETPKKPNVIQQNLFGQ